MINTNNLELHRYLLCALRCIKVDKSCFPGYLGEKTISHGQVNWDYGHAEAWIQAPAKVQVQTWARAYGWPKWTVHYRKYARSNNNQTTLFSATNSLVSRGSTKTSNDGTPKDYLCTSYGVRSPSIIGICETNGAASDDSYIIIRAYGFGALFDTEWMNLVVNNGYAWTCSGSFNWNDNWNRGTTTNYMNDYCYPNWPQYWIRY